MKNLFIFFALVSLVILSACEGKVENCSRDYNPVCGVNGKTYSNSCLAGKIEIKYEGECEDKHICTEEEKWHAVCADKKRVVCGGDGKTYDNGCKACSAKVEYWIEGECENFEEKCLSVNGEWIEERRECINIDEDKCEEIKGEFVESCFFD